MILDQTRSWRITKIKSKKERRRNVTVKKIGLSNSWKCIKRNRIR